MKQNIMVISYDYTLSKNISNMLAESFNMRAFDQLELFEFDHIPRSFEEVLQIEGKEYIYKKFRSIIKMELEFDNASFAADISLADNCEDIFYKIKLSNFVILLYKPTEVELSEVSSKNSKPTLKEQFFATTSEELKSRQKKINEACADISINIDGLKDNEIVSLIEKLIEAYYSVK